MGLISVKVEGTGRVLAALKRKLEQYAGRNEPRSAVVGYRAPHALVVHERRDVHHAVGRAGYLLDVARENRHAIAAVIFGAARRGRSILQALRAGAFYLKRLSQAEVPVDTGELRDSAFVETVDD